MADDKVPVLVEKREIQDMIYTIRGRQVMIDSNLADLYQVTTKRLNEQVNRNKNRFPPQFMFQLTEDEYRDLRSQIATSNDGDKHGGRRYMPYVFTEQGIAMLSSVLRSNVAVEVSIRIMDSFVEMRRFLVSNQELFSRLDRVELKQIETDKKLEQVFNYIATRTEVKQHIFFDGQIYDAFSFIVDLIKKAQNKLVLIDNYVDTNTLNLLCKKNNGVSVLIAGSGKGSLTSKDISKFNAQYQGLLVKTRNDFHDRFLIIDDTEVYHIGASIKDAGKKSFGITKIEDQTLLDSIINKVK
ncbi:MAG: ORF6N domain protein [Spirochaetes bacterium ADurb.Bin315]|nr:MAG: ORF6N domain protein [Spirochaetes bacterium ADurb.Bin315]HOE89510.1 ORF6N domain-containing protein [Sphaerochaeta sp.]